MTTILRTGFHDRQLNSLFESIVIDLFSSKKARLATSSDFPSRPIPSTPTVVVISSSDEKSSSVGNIPYHGMRKPFVVSVSVNEELFECANPSPLYLKPTYVPSREEMSKLLSCILFFTKREPLVHDIRVFFPVMQRILVEMDKDPNQSFMVRFPHDTSNTAISHIMNMNDYTAFETSKMVGHPLFFHLCIFSIFLQPLIS